ncbi:alpha/beta hydrolase [Mycolicibacterium pyrenivorans]|uniref:alpha/beta hydrolase n=1 Tax=Mycolicibacterium pyrenivorans TaxID=187102 RepID=UPI0021F2C4B7|nr:alpha/beta hydrolase [Mycolicibacterium pyrenivorans]MCV7150963.1 alpha/beta hydrolase [Mycolicibacterium pyrenivorans]
MTRPTVSQADAWRPDALRELADDLDEAARRLSGLVDRVVAHTAESRDYWTGTAADAARLHAQQIAADAGAVARGLIAASVAASDGAGQIASARFDVLSQVEQAEREGFTVAEDGRVGVGDEPGPLLVLLAGGAEGVAEDLLESRAAELSARIGGALERLGSADADAAADLAGAFGQDRGAPPPAATVTAGASPVQSPDLADAWPGMSQDRIAGQIAAMTPEQRDHLVTAFPRQVGNTDGVPWAMRVAANRLNIASAIVTETGADENSRRRIEFYRGLLGEIDDPVGRHGRIQRQIVAFDPGRASLIELNGDLASARAVAVLVPGVNTTIEGSAANTSTARRFVSGTAGDVAVITYLGGPFPQVRDPAAVLLNAADPGYAMDMAPRLVAFSEDVERTVPPGVPVTVIGHSYGGSIVGTAEVFGLTSDRTLFLAAAGAGVGVDDAGDWHNRNPDVLRFSMTAPGDFIHAVQGIPVGPHGADPDEMPGVTRLRTGRYDDGRPVFGWEAHSGMLNRPSDAWRAILAVIAGETQTLQRLGSGK